MGGKGGLGTQLYPFLLGYGATFSVKRPRRGQIKRQMTLMTLKTQKRANKKAKDLTDPEEGK